MPISKITCPKVIDVIQRKRLHSLLDAAGRKPVTWIAGPGGAGKTTLVADYLSRRKLPYLWYQLDEGDADLPTFFYYLGHAARNANPKSRKQLPLLTPVYLPGINVFTRRFFEKLYSSLKTHSVLVFDNYHHIPSDSLFHKIICDGLAVLPDNLRIIFISRHEPPATLTRFRANNAISYIGWNDMKLTLAETETFVYSRIHKKLGHAIIKQLHEKTDGWAAGLVLITEKGSGALPILQKTASFSRQEIFNYFATELFEGLPDETRQLLTKTSLFPRITADAACNLTGMAEAGQILAEMHQRHFFTNKYGMHGEAYQYHPLFREFLLTYFEKTCPNDEIKALKQKAARVLAENSQSEDAVILFLQSEDFSEAAKLICKLAQDMFSQGRVLVVKGWIDKFPREVIENYPWLFYWRGACTMTSNPVDSKKDFDHAFELFESQNDRAGMFSAWGGAVDDAFYSSDFRPLDHMISLLNRMLAKDTRFPSREIEASVTISMFGALCRRQPHHPDISIWENRSLNILRTNYNPVLHCKAGSYLVAHYLRHGNFTKASFALSLFRNAMHSTNAPDFVMLIFKSLETIHDIFTVAGENSQNLVFEMIKLADKLGVYVWEAHVIGYSIAAALSNGDISTADILFKRMESGTEGKERLDRCYYHFAKIWKAMLDDDNVTAHLHCKELRNISELVGDIPFTMISHVMIYEIFSKQGRTEEAEYHLAHAHQIADDMKSSFMKYLCLVSESYVRLNCADEQKALAPLQSAMKLGRENGFMNMLWWRPSVMSFLCAKALGAGIEVEYVQNIIKKRKLLPDKDVLLLDNWPYPLRIYTMGRFELVKDGKKIVFSRKVQQKPIALLKALIAFGGRAVPEAELTDALWPDADGYSAHRSFELALYRLRKLLGNDKALQFKDGTLTLDGQYCFVDIWGFQRLIKKAEDGWKKNQKMKKKSKRELDEIQEVIQLTDRVLEGYKGHFLDGDDSQPWIMSLRDILISKTVHIILALGSYREERKEYDKAVESYRRGLEIDNVREVLYQKLIINYHNLGRDAEAASAYQRCHSYLKANLDITPSLRTEEIYKAIKTPRSY